MGGRNMKIENYAESILRKLQQQTTSQRSKWIIPLILFIFITTEVWYSGGEDSLNERMISWIGINTSIGVYIVNCLEYLTIAVILVSLGISLIKKPDDDKKALLTTSCD